MTKRTLLVPFLAVATTALLFYSVRGFDPIRVLEEKRREAKTFYLSKDGVSVAVTGTAIAGKVTRLIGALEKEGFILSEKPADPATCRIDTHYSAFLGASIRTRILCLATGASTILNDDPEYSEEVMRRLNHHLSKKADKKT